MRKPRPPRCTALTQTLGPDGQPLRCRNYAWMPDGDQDEGPPLCYKHHPRALESPTRCTALTNRGERCRNHSCNREAQAAGAPALCATHVERGNAPAGSAAPGQSRRCTGRRQDGQPCRRWAARGSDPPRCPAHSRGTLPEKGDERRCRAFTRNNTRCRRWATIPSRRQGKPRCNLHGGDVHAPRPALGRRCNATSKDGQPCRSYALRDSDPPLCIVHSGRVRYRLPEAADYEAGRVCTATTLKGARCRNWAIPHTNPPRCYSHTYPNHHPTIRHGFYRQTPQFSKEWYAYIAELGERGDLLGAELMLLRLKLREVLTYMDPAAELPPGAFLAAARILNRYLRTVARLVEKREKLLEAGLVPYPPDSPGSL